MSKRTAVKTPKQVWIETCEREMTAYHEAGHVVYASIVGLPFTKVTVKKRGATFGQVSYTRSRKTYLTSAMGKCHVAGSVAQDILFGEDLHDFGCKTDMQRVVEMDDRKFSWGWLKEIVKCEIEEDPSIWEKIEYVAEALLKKGTLTPAQVARAIWRS